MFKVNNKDTRMTPLAIAIRHCIVIASSLHRHCITSLFAIGVVLMSLLLTLKVNADWEVINVNTVYLSIGKIKEKLED